MRKTKLVSTLPDTRIARASQDRACPHGTSAMPARDTTRHTSQQSSEVVAAAAVADSDAPEVVAAGTGVFVLAAAAVVVPRL